MKNVRVFFIFLTIVFLLYFAAAAFGEEATFTEMHDLVPLRCFATELSTVTADAVDIGINTGYTATSGGFAIRADCIASTAAFNARTTTDTFTVTITAPVGQKITKVHYEQVGSVFKERSVYWFATFSGTLTVNGAPTVIPALSGITTVAVDAEAVTVAAMIHLSVGRSSAYPRVTAAPGSATIRVTDAVIRVEFQ